VALAMNVHRKLKINWWLWACFSIPPIIYSWLKPHEVKGNTQSDWGYLTSYLQQSDYVINHDIWHFFIETLIWSAGPALLLGWIAQYFIILTWNISQQRRGKAAMTG
jgi:hypothetical protein